MNPPVGNAHAASHDKVAEMKEAFGLLDLAGDGFADVESMKSLLIAVCPGLSPRKLEKVLKETGFVSLPHVTFAQFFVVVTKIKSMLGLYFSSEELRELSTLHHVFAPFDEENTGLVDADIFMALMMEKGEKMSSQEGVEMRSRLERMGFMKKGKVNYRAFLNHITANVAS